MTHVAGLTGSAVLTTASGDKTHECENCRTDRCPLLDALQGTAGWQAFLRTKTMHRFKARRVVFYEGTPSSTVYVLCQGEVKLSVAGRDGISRIVHLLSAARTPGEILDKAGLGSPVHALTCEALTDCRLCCLTRADLAWLMRQEQELAARLLTAASTEAETLLQRLREGLAVQARQRLAKALVSIAGSHGVPTAQGIELDLTLRRQEWAELVGTSRETVARLFSALRREGLLALNGKRITILGYDRLNRLAV